MVDLEDLNYSECICDAHICVRFHSKKYFTEIFEALSNFNGVPKFFSYMQTNVPSCGERILSDMLTACIQTQRHLLRLISYFSSKHMELQCCFGTQFSKWKKQQQQKQNNKTKVAPAHNLAGKLSAWGRDTRVMRCQCCTGGQITIDSRVTCMVIFVLTEWLTNQCHTSTFNK